MGRKTSIFIGVDIVLGILAYSEHSALFQVWWSLHLIIGVIWWFIFSIFSGFGDSSSGSSQSSELSMAKINLESTYDELRRCKIELLEAEEYSGNYYYLENKIKKLEDKLKDCKIKVNDLSK